MPSKIKNNVSEILQKNWSESFMSQLIFIEVFLGHASKKAHKVMSW